MYHSISRNPGPTCISPETFEAQLDALFAQCYRVVSLRQVAAWRRGMQTLPPSLIYSAHEISDDALHQQALGFVQQLLDYPAWCAAPEGSEDNPACWSLPMTGGPDGA
jgi:hypothetical protein